MKTKLLALIVLVKLSVSYLDIQLSIKRDQDFISYVIPIQINDFHTGFAISFDNVQEFALSQHHKKKNKKNHQSRQGTIGVIKATTLQGYSFEGWKRFFMEALLWIESTSNHNIEINLSEITFKQSSQENMNGVISFGSDLQKNKILQLLKKQSDAITHDTHNIVSIYRGSNDKNVRLQIGGFEESFARGMKNGILFYELDLLVSDGKWKIPVVSVSCLRQKNGRDDIFYIANSGLNMSININSPTLKLPMKFAAQLQRNFQSPHTTCKIIQQNDKQRLSCSNFSSIDLALHSLQFKIDDGAYINISLYDLKRPASDSGGETIFNIQFVTNSEDIQIGEGLFKSYYVSIDLDNRKMMYSPLNRFPSQSYGIFIIRFLIGFGVFTIASALVAMLWQNFNDPFKQNRFIHDHDGIRLVQYSRPNELSQSLDD